MVVYGCCWRRREIIAFWEDPRVVGVSSRGRGSGGTRTVIGTVATSRVGRVFVAWRGLSMLVSMLVVGRLTSFLAFLFRLLAISPFGCFMSS
jgi:hypothetical protein